MSLNNFLTAVTTADKTATSGSDYGALTNSAVAFTGTATMMTFELSIEQDTIVEGTEQLEIALAVNAAVGTAGEVDKTIVNIVDDDVESMLIAILLIL